MKRSQPLRRTPLKRSAPKKRSRGVSPASPAQRAKVKDAVSLMSARGPCDPTHVWDRSLGGCDHPDCVIPLTRAEHRLYDDHKLDILAAMVAGGYVAELQHALGHVDGSLTRLLTRVTGERWIPESEARRLSGGAG